MYQLVFGSAYESARTYVTKPLFFPTYESAEEYGCFVAKLCRDNGRKIYFNHAYNV